MKIDEFKAAMRKACDDQVADMTKLLADFSAELKRLEDTVKAEPGADRKLISLVIAAEIKRYAGKLNAL